jgi:hypothetical protein
MSWLCSTVIELLYSLFGLDKKSAMEWLHFMFGWDKTKSEMNGLLLTSFIAMVSLPVTCNTMAIKISAASCLYFQQQAL